VELCERPACFISKSNRIHLVLFGIQNGTFGPYLADNNRVLISLVSSFCQQGSEYSVRLEGLKDMPKVASRKSVNLTSLLGPLLFLWLLQVTNPWHSCA
jgi:hypothetical protein